MKNNICPECGALKDQEHEFTRKALAAGQAGREAVRLWFDSGKLLYGENVKQEFNAIIERLRDAQFEQEQMTFDQMMASCDDLKEDQALYWWQELRDGNIPNPFLTQWLKDHGIKVPA